MKSPGKAKSLRLAAALETVDELRLTFDSFTTDIARLKEKLESNPHWLVETMWQIRKEIGIVSHENTSPRTGIALTNKIIGLSLDLEYLEDRAKEFAELLPHLIDPQIEHDFTELLSLLSSAESSLNLHQMYIQMTLMGVYVEANEQCVLATSREKVQSFLTRLENITVEPKSLKLRIQLIRLTNHYGALVKQWDMVDNIKEGLEKKELEKAAEQAKLYRFNDAQSAVAASCRKAKEWLERAPDESYLEGCQLRIAEVRGAMSELGLATTDLQNRPGYSDYHSKYESARSKSRSMLVAIDRAVTHHQNSSTWWGRLANWIDDCLKTKEPM